MRKAFRSALWDVTSSSIAWLEPGHNLGLNTGPAKQSSKPEHKPSPRPKDGDWIF